MASARRHSATPSVAPGWWMSAVTSVRRATGFVGAAGERVAGERGGFDRRAGADERIGEGQRQVVVVGRTGDREFARLTEQRGRGGRRSPLRGERRVAEPADGIAVAMRGAEDHVFGHQLWRSTGADETRRNLTMQRLPHGSRDLVVERFTNELVSERQPIVVARQYTGVQRYFEILEEIGGCLLKHGRKLGDGESGTEHGTRSSAWSRLWKEGCSGVEG